MVGKKAFKTIDSQMLVAMKMEMAGAEAVAVLEELLEDDDDHEHGSERDDEEKEKGDAVAQKRSRSGNTLAYGELFGGQVRAMNEP